MSDIKNLERTLWFTIKNMVNHVSTGVFTGTNFMPPDMPAENWVP